MGTHSAEQRLWRLQDALMWLAAVFMAIVAFGLAGCTLYNVVGSLEAVYGHRARPSACTAIAGML